jgi:lactoylglutathione lyase
MIDHVNALVLPVRDVEQCAAFYRDRVGLHADQIDTDEAYFIINPTTGPVLALLSMRLVSDAISPARARSDEESIHRSWFAVFVDDVDANYQELRGRGVHFLTLPTSRADGWRAAFFEDLEGNLWSIAQRPKRPPK